MKPTSVIVVLATLCAIKCSASEPVRTFHSRLSELRDTSIMFPTPGYPIAGAAVEIRASVARPSATVGKDSNGFAVVWHAGNDTCIEAWLIPTADDYDPLRNRRTAELILLRRVSGNHDDIISRKTVSGNIATGSGFNTLGVEIDESRTVTIYAGEKEPSNILTLPDSGSLEYPTGIKSRGTTKIDLLVTETIPDKKAALATGLSTEDIAARLNSHMTLPPEGLWTYLDRDTDERSMRLGGNYTLAIVADNPDAPDSNQSFTIVYLSGAKVDGQGWTPGMKKGRLTATLFQNHYNLKWISADMNEIDTECNAQLSDDKSIISFNFPLYGSTVRFARQRSEGALPAK